MFLNRILYLLNFATSLHTILFIHNLLAEKLHYLLVIMIIGLNLKYLYCKELKKCVQLPLPVTSYTVGILDKGINKLVSKLLVIQALQLP